MILTIIIWAVVLIFFAIGIAGTFLPIIPGTPFILLGALIYGAYEGFEDISTPVIVALVVITVFVMVVDYIAAAYGSKKFGKASGLAIFLTIAGAVVGLFVGLWGVIVFPILGAVIGELIMGKKLDEAISSGMGAFLGFIGGTFVKLTLVMVMLGIFFVAVI